jgi:5'/3'-nucleotidase
MADEILTNRDGKPVCILVTNDDGIHAAGLQSLEKIARELSPDVWVVAPETEQSGKSHSLTLNDPLRMRKIDDRHVAVHGTPADCVILAVRKVMPVMPDLVLSGVNRGQNMADDVTYSGTIAAAMEGTSIGLKSIALSQAFGLRSADGLSYDVAEAHGPQVLRKLFAADLGPGALININFPDCRPEEVRAVEVTRQGKRDQNLLLVDERIDTRGRAYYWLGFKREKSKPAPGTDLHAVLNRSISITPLHMNLTQIDAMEVLRSMIDGTG